MQQEFTFTVSDAARFLGKSAVTLRKWERQGLVTYPRLGNDRRFTTRDLRGLLDTAFHLGRITAERRHMADAVLTLLEIVERENRINRSAGQRQE